MNETKQVMQAQRTPSPLLHGLKLGLSLFVIAAVAAFILALVNAVTADTISRHAEEKRQAAMASVMPGANVFSEMYNTDATIDRISGAYNGTTLVGYCVEVSPSGFNGAIQMMVGVDTYGKVTGTSILDHGETAGLGAKADDPAFLSQYVGKSGTVTVSTGASASQSTSGSTPAVGSGKNTVQAITGATITSKAVTQGINTAVSAVINYDAQGGLDSEEHG